MAPLRDSSGDLTERDQPESRETRAEAAGKPKCVATRLGIRVVSLLCVASLAPACSSSESKSTPTTTTIASEDRHACGALRTLVDDVARQQGVFGTEIATDAKALLSATNESSNQALITTAHSLYKAWDSDANAPDLRNEAANHTRQLQFVLTVVDVSTACHDLGIETGSTRLGGEWVFGCVVGLGAPAR
jgi:hypothetical protein